MCSLRLLVLMCSFAQGFPVTIHPLITVFSTPPRINVFFCAGLSRDQPPSSLCTRRAPGLNVFSTPPLINVFFYADQPPSSLCTRRAPGLNVFSTPPLINVSFYAYNTGTGRGVGCAASHGTSTRGPQARFYTFKPYFMYP